MSSFKFPASATEPQQKQWANKVGLLLIEVKSLVTKGKKLQAVICRPDEIAVLMSSEKMSNLSGNNIAQAKQVYGKMCCLKSPDLEKECEQSEYRISHELAIGRYIGEAYEESEVVVKKSSQESS